MTRPIEGASRPKLAGKARLRWDKREQKFLLVYPERGLLLNETGSAIVRALDGKRTVTEVVLHLRGELPGGAPADLDGEVTRFLGRLGERGLLEWVE